MPSPTPSPSRLWTISVAAGAPASSPLSKLAGFFLQRLDTLGRELGAVATLCHDLALRQARQADDERRAGRDRGPLHGMPVGVKDLLAVPGYPTLGVRTLSRTRVGGGSHRRATAARSGGRAGCQVGHDRARRGVGVSAGERELDGTGPQPLETDDMGGRFVERVRSSRGGGVRPGGDRFGKRGVRSSPPPATAG